MQTNSGTLQNTRMQYIACLVFHFQMHPAPRALDFSDLKGREGMDAFFNEFLVTEVTWDTFGLIKTLWHGKHTITG